MRPLFFFFLFLLLIGTASADVVTQFNNSLTAQNFSTTRSVENFTNYFNVPKNSTVGASWIGTVRGTPLWIKPYVDLYVLNISGFKDSVRGTDEVKLTYANDQTMRRSYFRFNTTLNVSEQTQVLVRLPVYNGPSDNVIGVFNISFFEVFENATLSESTTTWNNQPCGQGHLPSSDYCNATPFAKVLFQAQVKNYNCSSDWVVVNVTEMALRRGGNVSFLAAIDRNDTYQGIFNSIYFCSKEIGLTQINNQTYPTYPTYEFGRALIPSNATFYFNATIVNVTTGILNESLTYNITLNSSPATNYSRSLLSPIPFTLQLGGPGVLELSRMAVTYTLNGLAASIQFNATPVFVVSTNQGLATFTRQFEINNTGTEGAINCSFVTTVLSGGDLGPFISYANFSVAPTGFSRVNVSVISASDGAYDNNVNVRCMGNSTGNTYVTASPTEFVFSISSPTASPSGGGGGGGGGDPTPRVISTGNGTFVLKTSFQSKSYALLGYPGQNRTIRVVLQNLATSNNTITVSCKDAGVCKWVGFSKNKVELSPNSQDEQEIRVYVAIPYNTSQGDYFFTIAGKDLAGKEQILPVSVRVDTSFQILALTFGKLFESYRVDLSSINPQVEAFFFPKAVVFAIIFAGIIALNVAVLPRVGLLARFGLLLISLVLFLASLVVVP